MSNVTRSVSITVVNATGSAMTYTASGGSTFGSGTANAYSTRGFTAQSQSSDLKGCLNFVGDGMNFSLWYDASSDSGSTYFRTDAAVGSLFVYQGWKVGGHSVEVEVALYQGVLASGTEGYAIKLADADSIGKQMQCAPWIFHDFVEQMFAPNMRDVTGAIAAVAPTISSAWATSDPPAARPPVYYADMTGGQIPTIVDILAAYWMDASKPCASSDKRIIDFFKSFITYGSTPSLGHAVIPELYMPRFHFMEFSPPDSTFAVLYLEAYDTMWFRGESNQWAEDVVRIFLTLLVTGAHFVTMRYTGDGVDADYSGAMDFRSVLTGSKLATRGDLGNSHYTSGVNTSGYYYISDIDGDTLPAKVDDGYESDRPGLLISLMTALTNAGLAPGDVYNCFFQLEGWPAHGITNYGGTRHHQDYQTSLDTLWNISTFGASPYSEKRAGSLFIAPPGWTPVVTEVTGMMPYYGNWMHYDEDTKEYQRQPWLDNGSYHYDWEDAAAINMNYVQN